MSFLLVRPGVSDEERDGILSRVRLREPGAQLRAHRGGWVLHIPEGESRMDDLIAQDPNLLRSLARPVEAEAEPGPPLVRHVALLGGAWLVVLLAVLVALAAFFPPGLGEPADPHVPPPRLRPEWYFLALHSLLALVPAALSFLGYFAVGASWLLAFCWPYLDRTKPGGWASRVVPLVVGCAFVAGWILLTLRGYQA